MSIIDDCLLSVSNWIEGQTNNKGELLSPKNMPRLLDRHIGYNLSCIGGKSPILVPNWGISGTANLIVIQTCHWPMLPSTKNFHIFAQYFSICHTREGDRHAGHCHAHSHVLLHVAQGRGTELANFSDNYLFKNSVC